MVVKKNSKQKAEIKSAMRSLYPAPPVSIYTKQILCYEVPSIYLLGHKPNRNK
jgi:hypothetical protein